jgi:hypothetical protein
MMDKTQSIISAAYDALAEENPMTVREIHYVLVVALIIENTIQNYKAVSRALVKARKEGLIPWDWIEDRIRIPHDVPMWEDLSTFGETVLDSYKRDIWQTQENYVACWVEKDAISGFFVRELEPYRIAVNVGRGFDGWDSIYKAAQLFKARAKLHKSVTVLYFGDFDPSGEEMVTSLRKRLGELGARPNIIKCALTKEQILKYSLPPIPTKETDSRRAKFIAQNGDACVEFEALSSARRRAILIPHVESLLNMNALRETLAVEGRELKMLAESIEGWRGAA